MRIVVIRRYASLLSRMNWWDVEYRVIGPSTAFDVPRPPRNVASPRDRRARRERELFPDHRRDRFIPPVDVDGTIIAERFTRMDIYARDGGICQLCLESVDFDALW